MFTGIVEEVGKVVSCRSGKLVVKAAKVLRGVEPGASIAVNGVCLTVTHFDAGSFSVDVMPETLRRSNLGVLVAGSVVNLERPLAVGGRLGGHFVQGHVDGTGRISFMQREKEAMLVKVDAGPEIMRYIVEKGFVAVDGISLTVMARETAAFQVSIVEHTWRNTNLGERRLGDAVNLEIDVIAKYVERLVHPGPAGMTADFLRDHGFLEVD